MHCRLAAYTMLARTCCRSNINVLGQFVALLRDGLHHRLQYRANTPTAVGY